MSEIIDNGLEALERHMHGAHIVGDYKKIKDALLHAKKALNELHPDTARRIMEYSEIKENEYD